MSCPDVVRVTVPDGPAVVRVATPGPPGPTRPLDEVRIDVEAAGTIYVGKAPNGAAESSPNWSITRTTYSTAGVRQTLNTAHGVTWAGRTGHTYS